MNHMFKPSVFLKRSKYGLAKTTLQKKFLLGIFDLLSHHKYLNVLKSGYNCLRKLKKVFLKNVSQSSEFMLKARKNMSIGYEK